MRTFNSLIRDEPYWTSRKDSCGKTELIELYPGQHKRTSIDTRANHTYLFIDWIFKFDLSVQWTLRVVINKVHKRFKLSSADGEQATFLDNTTVLHFPLSSAGKKYEVKWRLFNYQCQFGFESAEAISGPQGRTV